MSKFIKEFVTSGAVLDNEERNLLSIAYKNVIGEL
jgi:hypothetical protein